MADKWLYVTLSGVTVDRDLKGEIDYLSSLWTNKVYAPEIF